MRKQVFEEQDKLMKLVDVKPSKIVKQSSLDTYQQLEESVELETITLSDGSVQDRVVSILQGEHKNKEETLKTADGLQNNSNVVNSQKRKLEETNNVGSHVPPQPKRKKGATKAKVYLCLHSFYFIDSPLRVEVKVKIT